MALFDLINNNDKAKPAAQPNSDPFAALDKVVENQKPQETSSGLSLLTMAHEPPQKQSSNPLTDLANMQIDLTGDVSSGQTSSQDADFPIWDVPSETACTVICDSVELKQYADTLSVLLHKLAQEINAPSVGATTIECMEYLKEHAQLRDILAPENLGVMVKGLRASYYRAYQPKVVRKEKRTKKSQKLAENTDLLGLGNLDLGL